MIYVHLRVYVGFSIAGPAFVYLHLLGSSAWIGYLTIRRNYEQRNRVGLVFHLFTLGMIHFTYIVNE